VNDADGCTYWRVGYHTNPLGFIPLELYTWNHRFDDGHRRFRSLYAAEMAETAIREVLADLRPNAAAIRRYAEKFGPEAIDDVHSRPVTESWRRQHVLASAHAILDGDLIDLCDPDVRHDVELRHAGLLDAHGMHHLDLAEVTARRRPMTQAIAADLYERLGAAGVRFPSRLDGNPCIALFEGRGLLEPASAPIALVDPAPQALQNVCAGWRLDLAPAQPPERTWRPRHVLDPPGSGRNLRHPRAANPTRNHTIRRVFVIPGRPPAYA
jgi:hypothetical protein